MDENMKLAAFRMPGTKGQNRLGFDFKKFYRKNRRIVNKACLILGIILIVFVACRSTRTKTIKEMEDLFAERLAQERVTMENELKAAYGFDLIDNETALIEREATALAKMLYPYQYNTDEGLKSACWCAIFRKLSNAYPNTIEEVCAQPQQWMGWSEDNPVIQRLYNIAYEQLRILHSGGALPMNTDYIYMEWTSKEITLRTTFDGKGGCHYWYEADWNA